MEQRYLILYRRLAVLGGAGCILLFLVAGLREGVFEEWHEYQREYRELRLRLARSEGDSLAAEEPVAIAEIALPRLGRVDRCISCHQGIEDTLSIGAPQPLGFHPGDLLLSHDTKKFGCTLCHGGNGRALEVLEICGKDTATQKPAHSLDFVQAWCAQCHGALFEDTPFVRGAENLTLGRTIVREGGCLGCHKILGTGGVLGPDLTNEGGKSRLQYNYEYLGGAQTDVGWLRAHFREPARIVPGSLMLPYNLPPDSMDALVTFVLGLRTTSLPLDYFAVERMLELRSRQTLREGEEVYGLFCSACHGREGKGRSFTQPPFGVPALANPDFQAVASAEFLEFTVRHGRSGRRMASWSEEVSGMRPEERAGVVEWIRRWRKVGLTIEAVRRETGSLHEGKLLFEKECRLCHTAERRPGAAPHIENPDFLSLASDRFLIETIIGGRANTAMPSWSRLTALEVASLLRYLRSLAPAPARLEEEFTVRGNPDRGARLFSYCTRCHGKDGMGGIGPAILNPSFLKTATPGFIRSTITSGRAHTAMFGWSEGLKGGKKGPAAITDDILAFMLSRRDIVPDRIFPGQSVGRPLHGEELFASHCAECHGPKGEGVTAPALNNQEFLNAASNGFLLATITLGREGTPMPSWGRGDLKHPALALEQRQDLVAYIRLWQQSVIYRAPPKKSRVTFGGNAPSSTSEP